MFVALVLSGCERKNSTTTTSSGSTSVSSTSSQTVVASESATADTSDAISTTEDNTTLAATYKENLSSATTKVQKVLNNTATFCSALIEIPNGYTLSQASQQFFFSTTRDGLTDWYWVVTVDPIEQKERHSLVAKSGYTNDIECTDLAVDDIKISYNEAYERASETGSLSSGADVAKTVISLKGSAWRIVQYNNEGKYSVKEVDATNAYVSSSQATTTATSESILQ